MVRNRMAMMFVLLIGLFATSGCVHKNLVKHPHKKNAGNVLDIEGWERVAFADHADYFRKNRGKLAYTYDEFVGALLDQGLDVDQSEWLKPTYGNQNILWTFDRALGKQRVQRLIQSKSEFSPRFYDFYENTLNVSDTRWQYAGYKDKSSGVDVAPFQTFVYVCGNGSSGLSIFYWGSDILVEPHKTVDVKNALTKLSDKCK